MLSWTPYTWRVRSSVVAGRLVGWWHWWNYDWQAGCWFTRLIFKCLFCVWRLALETDLKIEREWRGTLQQNLDKEKAKVAKLQTDVQHLEETKKVAQSYHFYHVCSASEESAEKACVYRELYNGQSFSLAEMIQTDLPSTPRSTHSSSVVTLSCPPTISSLKITDHLFRYASPHFWNQLPDSFCQPRRSCHPILIDSTVIKIDIDAKVIQFSPTFLFWVSEWKQIAVLSM